MVIRTFLKKIYICSFSNISLSCVHEFLVLTQKKLKYTNHITPQAFLLTNVGSVGGTDYSCSMFMCLVVFFCVCSMSLLYFLFIFFVFVAHFELVVFSLSWWRYFLSS